MTNKLGAFLLTAAVSLGLGAVTPARALIALPNPSDFVFIESVNGSSGTYTIENNSADWYIWAFSVTNTNATDPSTTQFHWNAGPCDRVVALGLDAELFMTASVLERVLRAISAPG